MVAGVNLNLFNQHSDRVRMANIAQMINVLQAVILTDQEKMVLTPTYHVFDMYKVHQGATSIPVELQAPDFAFGALSVPSVSASASKDAKGTLHVSLVNLDPKSSKQLATPAVRDRITVGVVTDPTLKPAGMYDLVICREVLEHLTVLQVKQAVANMVRLTSKFIYVTTRFHPRPATLLDFTTQFDVDPSHITLLNKDMLRLMFVLEGCRSRPDLEARMDWGNKGRVLVLEKVSDSK